MNLPEDRPDARTAAADDAVPADAPDQADAGIHDDAAVGSAAAAHPGTPADPPVADAGAGAGLSDPSETPVTAAIGASRLPLVLILAVVILVVDQITKIIAVATLTPGVSPSILGGLVHFSLLRNAGAAFSLGTGMTWILALVACVVVVVIVRIASRLRSGWWATCLGLILGGAVGNLIDRFFRAPGFLRGHVVDFVSVFGPDAQYFPVFNVADSSITIGAILLVLTSLRGIELDGTSSRARTGATTTTTTKVSDA